MQITLHGARLADASMDLSSGDITLQGAQILAVGSETTTAGPILDATDSIIVPGFIEVHTHGGGGFNLHTTNADEIRSYARWIATTGVTSFLIAVVGTPNALPEAQLRTAVEVMEQPEKAHGAQPLGIFLEGPYINVKRRGAHPPIWLRTPDHDETAHILALTKGYLRLVTLAPELPGGAEMVQQLVRAGVTVSIGHTDATYEQAQEAFRLGVTHATHCFNAMRPLLHRAPGPIAAIAETERVAGEVIADGIHVHPAMVNILVRALGPERTIVITDAQAAAGIPEGTAFEFGGQQARVLHGAARLADGTLAGSILTMERALRNILDFTHVSLSDAVGMLTLNPARSIGVAEQKGLLRPGYDADLLVLNKDLHLQATICRGEVAYATAAWRERWPSA